MVDEINRIRTIVEAVTADAERKFRQYGQTVTEVFTIQNKVITATASKMGTTIRIMETNRQRFQMFWLSIMFGAMQMQRTLGRVFADWKKDFFTITENTTALGQATLRLQGAMTFLSVSIMTALEPILVPLIEHIIDLVNWFSDLPPAVQRIAGMFVLGGLFTASIMFAGAQIALFINEGIIKMGIQFGLLAKDINTGAISITKNAKVIASSFLDIVPWIIIAALAIYAIWKNIGPMITWENKKNIDIQKRDWTALRTHSIAQSIEMRELVPKILSTMAFSIGDVFHLIITVIGHALFLIPKTIISLGAMLPGPLGEIMAKARVFLDEWEGEFDVTMGTLRTVATEGYTNIMEGMTATTIQEMVKMGISLEDIIDVYGETGNTIITLTEMVNKGIITQEQLDSALINVRLTSKELTITNDLLKTSFAEVKTQLPAVKIGLDDVSNSINKMGVEINQTTEKIEGMTNAWRIAGTQGVWTFNVGGKGVDVQKMIDIIASGKGLPNKQTGGFIHETGPYLLHKGETVMPKGEAPSIGDINVNITTGPISSPADENELARKVSERILADIQNYTKYVGHF